MRFEDKEVDGPELELEQERQSELEEEDEEKLPELETDKSQDTTEENLVAMAMRDILERRHIVVNDLRVSKREKQALEALKTAVEGKDKDLNKFVYAEDRRDLLEQALAILQPNLVASMDTTFKDMIHRVGELRHGLKELEDAQDELMDANEKVGLAMDAPDTDDKPKPKPDDDVTLTGPPRDIKKPPTALTGAEIKEAPKGPSTLEGPALKDDQKPASSLYGADLKEPSRPKSSLDDGPAVKDIGDHETTLGSKEDIAAVTEVPEPQKDKKKPWWRRPFGG